MFVFWDEIPDGHHYAEVWKELEWLFFQAFMKASEDFWDSGDPFLFSVPV